MTDFKKKTGEEIAEMSAEEQIKYYNDLNEARNKELEDLKTKLKEENKEEIQTQIDSLKEEISEANKEQYENLTKALETQGIALKQLMSKGGDKNGNTLKSILESKKAEIAKAYDKPVTFTIDKTDILTSSVSDSTIAMREQSIGQIARPRNVLRQLFATGVVSEGMGGTVRYIDQATNTNGAAMQTEGEAKGEGAITWVEKTMSLETVAEYIPVSRQALQDFSFIESEIRNKLVRDLAYKVEGQVWNGTGVAPNLKGVYTYADTYTAAGAGITDASIYDLAVKVAEDIAGDTSYMPNVIIMNITDINKMKLKKDANNNYVMPPFVTNSGQVVDGMTVVASSQVTTNTMLVGDFDYATLYSLGGVEITVGYIDKQFTKNMVSILAEERLGLLVRSVETDAFRKVTDIDAALVTLAS